MSTVEPNRAINEISGAERSERKMVNSGYHCRTGISVDEGMLFVLCYLNSVTSLKLKSVRLNVQSTSAGLTSD